MLKLRVFAPLAAVLLQLSTGFLFAQTADEPGDSDINAALDAAVQEATEQLFSPEAIDEPEDGHREPPPWARIPNRANSVSQVTSPAPALTGTSPADAASTRPSDLLRQVPRVRLDGETDAPVDQAPAVADDNDDDVVPEDKPEPKRSSRKSAKKAEPTKKPGFVRGIIGSIPIVGPRIAGTRKNEDKEEEREEPKQTPERKRVARSDDNDDDVLKEDPAPQLFAPPSEGGTTSITTSTQIGFSTPIVEPHPAAPGQVTIPEAPPERTIAQQPIVATPAASQPVRAATPFPLMAPASTPVAQRPPAPAAPIRVQVGMPTVAQVPAGAPVPTAPPADAAAAPESAPLPKPPAVEAEVATAPAVVASVPAATPLPVTPVPTMALPVSTPSLEPNDLGLPAPNVEDNTVLHDEFVAAVKEARASNYATAAKLFRDYGDNHPSSKLAPRAYFLAALLEGDPVRSAEAGAALKSQFPKDKYTRRLDDRRKAEESPERLERSLADAAGTPAEHQLRVKLAQALLKQGNPRRVRDILEPFVADAAGTPEEADYLVLLSEAYLALQDLQQATAVLGQIQTKFPEAARNPRVRLNAALVNEEGGYYQRATALYSAIMQESPQAPEAQTASERLRDLRRLTE